MALHNTHYGADGIREMLRDCRGIFFIGIGGINMSSLAHVTHLHGYRTGGSDRTRTPLTDRLAQEGIEIFGTHDARNLDGYDAVVYTVAIAEDNAEYREAVRRGIPCISRSDYMGYLMTSYRVRIGISGSHGKSTCTSMCAEVLMKGNKNPTVLSGAPLASMDGAYRVGGEDFFLFEACEYMDSFLDFNPSIAVILNVELDHVDYFPDLETIRRSFCRFAQRTAPSGMAVVNGDDENVRLAMADFSGDCWYFGIESADARMRATAITERNGKYAFDIMLDGERYCHVALQISGRHQIYNALACASVAYLCGLSGEDAARALHDFMGAKRRMEYKGQMKGASLYDDYAHHPTEIRSTLEGAKKLAKGRLLCVFQSHTYSRTAALFEEFSRALSLADRILITDVYAAREIDTYGMTPEKMAERIGERASAVHGFREAADRLREELREGDVAVIMGAGDVFHVFDFLELES